MEFACLHADATLDTPALINHMFLFSIAGDTGSRAVFRTHRTSDAVVVYHELKQFDANSGRTSLFIDVRQIFVHEIVHRREHRIR